jgi:3-methyl-2-oxobutanoate hydroxymethyltransferase
MVIEAVAEPLAEKITHDVAIPTIGIGASAAVTGRCWSSRTCWD